MVRLPAGPASTTAPPRRAAATGVEVDVALVLALDASGSIEDEWLAFQRRAHARAIVSSQFIEAVQSGEQARIALAAMEWSGADRQRLTVPWTMVESRADAERFGEAITAAPRSIPGFTAIGAAILQATALLDVVPWLAARHVVDILANGEANDGPAAAAARDTALDHGVTINGLVIPDRRRDLGTYFEEEVIGGPGAFVVIARGAGTVQEALLRKLLREVT